MKKILTILLVGCLVALPLSTQFVEADGVGVEDTPPWISSGEITRNRNGYDVDFEIVHLNGVDSIDQIAFQLISWRDMPEMAFELEFVENETVVNGDTPDNINIVRTDTREGIKENQQIILEISLSVRGSGYSSIVIEVVDFDNNLESAELSFPSLFSGHTLSMVSIPLVGVGVVFFVLKEKGESEKKDFSKTKNKEGVVEK